jgi:hypothetical protein
MRTSAERHQHFNALDEAGQAVALSRPGADRALLFAEIRIAHVSSLPWIVSASPTNPLHSITHPLKLCDNPIPMVALNLDPPVLDRAPSAKPGLQLGGKVQEPVLIQGKVGDGCHSLASPTLGFPADSDDGLARVRCFALAGACALELMALWAKQVSPVVLSHCRGHLFFLPIFDTIRFFSIFFRKWANFVAGLRGICRPLPAIVVLPYVG